MYLWVTSKVEERAGSDSEVVGIKNGITSKGLSKCQCPKAEMTESYRVVEDIEKKTGDCIAWS